MNEQEAIKYFSNKENVLTWFRERGIDLCSTATKGCLYLSKFKWIDKKLFFVIKGTHDGWSSIDKTEVGKIDMCYTHRDDGSSILIYELYRSYKATFKNIDEIVKHIKIKELEEKEEYEKQRLEYEQKNQELITSLEIGNILVHNDGMANVEFFQVVNKNEIKSELIVRLLKKIYLGFDKMDDKVSCKLNDFANNSKDRILTKKNYIPNLFEKEFAREYAGN